MNLNCQQLFTEVATRFYDTDPDRLHFDAQRWQNTHPAAQNPVKDVHQALEKNVARIFNRLNDIMTYAALAPLTADDAGYSLKKLDLAAQVLALETDRATHVLCAAAPDDAAYDEACENEKRELLLQNMTIAALRDGILRAYPKIQP